MVVVSKVNHIFQKNKNCNTQALEKSFNALDVCVVFLYSGKILWYTIPKPIMLGFFIFLGFMDEFQNLYLFTILYEELWFYDSPMILPPWHDTPQCIEAFP